MGETVRQVRRSESSGRDDGRPCRRPAGADTPGRRSSHAARGVTSLHTLGPAGTNCELAARRWFDGRGRGDVVLYPTLEAAAAGALATPGGALLAPAAYPDLHTLMYSHVDDLTLADSLVMATHRMVLARRPGADRLSTVASHPAPVALVSAGMVVSLVASNSQAASDCAEGLVDACITTEAAMSAHGLELVRDFGTVSMAFTIHVRAADGTARQRAVTAHYAPPKSSDA